MYIPRLNLNLSFHTYKFLSVLFVFTQVMFPNGWAVLYRFWLICIIVGYFQISTRLVTSTCNNKYNNLITLDFKNGLHEWNNRVFKPLHSSHSRFSYALHSFMMLKNLICDFGIFAAFWYGHIAACVEGCGFGSHTKQRFVWTTLRCSECFLSSSLVRIVLYLF